MKNKTKLKKLGIVPQPHTPVYAKGTRIINAVGKPELARRLCVQNGSKYITEGFSVTGRSYHVKPSLFRQNAL